VTYTLQNDFNLPEDVALKSSSGGGPLTGLPAKIAASPSTPYQSTTVTHSGVPGTASSAALSVVGTWTDGYNQTDSSLVSLAGDCQPSTPPTPPGDGRDLLRGEHAAGRVHHGHRGQGCRLLLRGDRLGQRAHPDRRHGLVAAGDYTVIAMRGEQTVKTWDVTIGAATCTVQPNTVTPPPVTKPGPANPQASVQATCAKTEIELTNLTAHVGDASATFQITVDGTAGGGPVTVAAGATQSVTYTAVGNPYTVAVLVDGSEISSATTADQDCVLGVVIPGAKPSTVEPVVVPTVLPHTGAGSLPLPLALVLAGAGLVPLGPSWWPRAAAAVGISRPSPT